MYFAGVKSFKAIFAQNKNEEAEFQKRTYCILLHFVYIYIYVCVCVNVCIYGLQECCFLSRFSREYIVSRQLFNFENSFVKKMSCRKSSEDG